MPGRLRDELLTLYGLMWLDEPDPSARGGTERRTARPFVRQARRDRIPSRVKSRGPVALIGEPAGLCRLGWTSSCG
jgi:hypothetical protein